MRLEQRKSGGWVLVAKHVATGADAEAPFEVVETKPGRFELWAFGSEDADEMTLHEGNLSKKALIDHAETILPPQWA
jgi:hypothetical protein